MNIAREPRIKVTIRASMCADGPRSDVCIRDISRRGLMLIAATPPPLGTYVEVMVGGQTIVGRVTWSKERRFGVRTSDRIEISSAFFGGARWPSEDSESDARTPRAAAISRGAHAAPDNGFGRAAQFVVIIVFAAGLSVAMAMVMYRTLANSVNHVTSHLQGSGSGQ